MTPAARRLRDQLCAALRRHLAGEPPAPPLAGVPLWQAFAVLSEGREWGHVTPQPIRPEAIEAWARLACVHLPPHHLAILQAMDRAWLAEAAKPAEKRPKAALTAEAFDAMFG